MSSTVPVQLNSTVPVQFSTEAAVLTSAITPVRICAKAKMTAPKVSVIENVDPGAHEGTMELKSTLAVKLVSTLLAKPIHKVYYQQATEVTGVDMEAKGHLPG